MFRKRVLCLLGSIFCLWFVICWQKGGYQIVNCIRDFEENGLWHFNDRQRWIFSSPEPKAHKVSLYPVCLKTLCSLSPPPVMLHINFEAVIRPSVVVRPSVRRRPHFQTWISLKPVCQTWSLGWRRVCIRFWDWLDHNSGFHGNRNSPSTYNGENDVSTFSRLFLIRSFLYLQVTRACIHDEFEFRPDRTTATDYGVSCPWASNNSP